MRYVIKQKVFAIGDTFTIKDESGKDCFSVKGRIFALGNKLRMYDMQGQELVYIEQKLLRLLPEYNIYYQGLHYARVKKEFSLFKPRFNIQSFVGDYSIQGNFLNLDFSIHRGRDHVAQVSKKWLSWGDTYGVEIFGQEDHPFILTLVIVIDQVLHDNNSNKS
ncbi:MAG TPA: LURP-one-related family protein [Bacillota bacterium]|nr:LURP-one-related family protein [Bacillota bacterium]